MAYGFLELASPASAKDGPAKGRHSLSLRIILGMAGTGLSALPRGVRDAIEDAVRGSLVSGFSTTIVVGAVIAIASSAFSGLFRDRVAL
jgi:hypothetical protein